VHTIRLRRARFLAVLLATALVLGLLYGLVIGVVGQPGALLTWWGTTLRGLIAVGLCFSVAGAADRRWSARR
jgi:hypothetical protein